MSNNESIEVIQPVLTTLSEIEPEKLKWLWEDKIPMGKVTLLVGDPGIGKSFLTMFMVAQVSTGRPWPDLATVGIEVGSVILLTAEDDLADTVRVRLEAADADLNKIVALSAFDCGTGNNIERFDLFGYPDKLSGIIRKAIEDTGNVRLVVIDPITAYMGGKNSNSNTEVRQFLGPLAELASEYKVAIVGVSHLNKNSEASADYRTLGSIGFVAAARAVWMVMKDPDDDDRRLFVFSKGNLSRKLTGLAFHIIDMPVKTDNGDASSGVCTFEPEIVYKTADEILSAQVKRQKGPSKKEEAAEWLKEFLADGPKPAKEIFECAEEVGIAKRTLERAKKDLGIRPEPNTSGERKYSEWSL